MSESKPKNSTTVSGEEKRIPGTRKAPKRKRGGCGCGKRK